MLDLTQKPTFDVHINGICENLGLKLSTLARMTPYKDFSKILVILMKYNFMSNLVTVSSIQ